jgi:stage V sporulation protein G
MLVDTAGLSVKRLVRFDGEGSLKAFCDIAIGEALLVKGLRVVDGKNGLFVSMPRQQTKAGRWFDTVSALTKEMKEEIGRVVLEAYQQQPA